MRNVTRVRIFPWWCSTRPGRKIEVIVRVPETRPLLLRPPPIFRQRRDVAHTIGRDPEALGAEIGFLTLGVLHSPGAVPHAHTPTCHFPFF